MPVIMFRAFEGWCDRLQVLAHCITYCKEFNTALCVDWDDYIWGGNREFDFNDCFEIVGIRTMSKTKVCQMAHTGKFKIRPPCWDAMKMWNALTTEIYETEYIGEFMNAEIKKVEGDILVTNGKGDRRYDTRELVEHLRFQPEVIKGIQKRLKDFDPNSVVVHLRGTDRPDEKGDWTEKCIEATKTITYKIFVVTDQLELWERFHKEVPHSQLVNPNSSVLRISTPDKRGTHQLIPPELKELGITKWEYMLDVLADWVALVFARQGCGRSESTYFDMARRLNQNKNKENILRGWEPHSKSIQEYNEALLLSHREQTEIQQGVSVVVPTAQDVC